MSELVNITVQETIEAVTPSVNETGDVVSIAVVDESTDVTFEITEKYGVDGVTPVKGVDYVDGKDFKYGDFTPEQIEALKVKGDKGDSFAYGDFTLEQLAALKGNKGDSFTYQDFTSQQLENLKVKGDPGKTPKKGEDYADGIDGKSIEIQLTATHIQTRQTGGEWINLIAIADLKIKGDAFTFADFTTEQLALLKGQDAVLTPQILSDIAALVTIPDSLSDFSDDSTHRLVTDAEKSTWNGKQPAGNYLVANDIASKADISLSIAMAVAL